MNSHTEGVLMLKWVEESKVLDTADYGFLTNLYLEVIHLAESMPHNPEGRHIQFELIRLSSRISNGIDDLEDQFDGIVSEIFESTTDEIMEEEEEEDRNVEYKKTIIIQREINIVTSWTIDRVEGPIGEVPRDNVYDFSEFDVDEITSSVEQWASDQGIEEIIDLDLLSGSEEIEEELSFDFDDELAPITVYVTVRQTYTWDGDDNYFSEDGWEEA